MGSTISRIPIVGNVYVGLHQGLNSIQEFFTGIDMGDVYEEQMIPLIIYSPAAIFSNMIPALDVNFINPKVWYNGGKGDFSIGTDETGKLKVVYNYREQAEPESEEEKFKDNTAYQLQSTIATWYVALRNIAIVGLLSVLVYVAIRIIMSSTAGETAKYKAMLKDWLVAMCILFVMHYMMAFLLKTTDMITQLFVSDVVISNINTETDIEIKGDRYMNDVRRDAELFEEDDEEDILAEFGYTLIYIILIFYTIIFTWKYLKRFVYLAFLTMIAPLVAFTYPIDKLKDGSAQAFNTWFKEYVFNVLIQPIHLLLYTILITSAADFAAKNMIYTIVAIGFMLEAEKIIKSLFGFNKAEGGVLSSAITGGAIFGTVAGLMKNGASKVIGGHGGKSSSGGSEGGKVRFNNREPDSGATKNLNAFTLGGATGVGAGAKTASGNGKYNTNAFNTISKGYNALGAPYRGIKTGLKGRVNAINSSKAMNFARKLGSDIAITPPARVVKGVAKVGGRFINKDNAKKAIKLAAVGMGAATLGTIGVGAGIASDKAEDVLKYGGLGATTGGVIGDSAYDMASSAISGASNIKDSFQQGYYGDDYVDKILNPKLDKEWEKDKNIQEYFKVKYGANYKKRMEEALQLRKAGVTDQDEIDSALKLMERNAGLTTNQAANIMQFTKGLNKSDLLNDESRKNIRDSAYKMVNKDSNTADKVMDLVDQRFKLK